MIGLERIQTELKYAFKWMTRGTELAKQGDFGSATYCMTIAQQHWNNCQHYFDRYVDDDEAKKTHWDFFVVTARELAEKELAEDDE